LKLRDGCGGCELADHSYKPVGRGLTQRILVSTLEQSPERGGTAAIRNVPETAPASERDEELTNGDRGQTCTSDPVAKRNEE
jgi:hypothetical protein